MNTYSMQKPRSYDWTKAFLVSVVVHLFLVALWVGAILLEIFQIHARDLVEDKIPKENYVTMPMEMVEAFQQAQPDPETPPEPPVPEESFQHTRPSQETSKPVESTRYFGERNTAAASEGEILDEGLAVPSQDGREARTENDRELVDSDFADGETAGAPGNPGEPVPVAPTALLSEPTPPTEMVDTQPSEETEPLEDQPEETPVFEPTEIAEPSEVEEPSDDERLQMAQNKAAELLALNDSIPVPKDEEDETPEAEEKMAPKEAIPEPKPKPKPASLAGGVSGNRGLDGGFDREARRTRMSGTIRRRGESSLEVEDTVKGRYFAELNKQVEKAWQRECVLRREYILPGVLSVRFSVNDAGKVSGFGFDSRINGGAIQEGFTMRAIQKAKIPAMPEEIKGELNGDLLEMNLTFFF